MATPTTDTLADARTELEARIRRGRLRSADDLREDFPAAWADPESRLELVYAEYVLRVANGEQPARDGWFTRYPEWHERLERLFGLYDLMAGGDTHHPAATVGDARPVPTPPTDANHPDGYEVLGEVGRGGMAVVYQARQLELNRVVALKVLRWGGWEGADDVRRVRREAELVARLQHPNIVQVIEVGEWDGSPFLALEYVPGGTLADALARTHRQGKTGVSTAEAVALVELLARATQYAHEQGVIHRDLKPANVLLADDPAGPFARPKITDFGLAVSTELSAAVSQSAMLAGTPCYMAPEQATARRDAVGPRTDVYALGGILYELLTGRPPFQGATVLETLDLVRHAEPVAPRQLRPHLPRDLDTVCLKCLSKDPARRYESAAALADDLARVRDGRPITARPVGAGERVWKWCRRQPLLAGMLCGLMAAVGVAVVLPSLFWRQAEAGREREAGLRQAAEEREARLLLKTARLQWLDHDLEGARESLLACDQAHRPVEWHHLWRATRPPVFELSAGEPTVVTPGTGLFYSGDGSSILLIRQNDMWMWDVASRTQVPLAVATLKASVLAFPRRDVLIVAESLGTPKGGKVVATDLTTNQDKVLWQTKVANSMVVVTADARFAVAKSGQVATVIDLTTGKETRKFAITEKVLRHVLSPDGRKLALVALGPLFPVVHVADGTPAYQFTCPQGRQRVAPFTASPDCTRAAYTDGRFGSPIDFLVVSPEGTARIDSGLTGISDVVFSPDGSRIASWGDTGQFVGVWDTTSGQEVVILRGHRDRIQSIAFSPDSKRLAVGSAGGRVAIWDVTAN